MAGAYSKNLRSRVLAAVENGETPEAAARRFKPLTVRRRRGAKGNGEDGERFEPAKTARVPTRRAKASVAPAAQFLSSGQLLSLAGRNASSAGMVASRR